MRADAALSAHVDLDLGPGLGEIRAHVGHPDPALERGREGAAGDHARLGAVGVDDRVALARDPAPGDRERRQPLGGPGGARRGDRLGADEARLLLAAPAEAGLDRVAVLGEVVAVEVEADLEPQGVAGGEPGRHGPRLDQRRPQRRRRARLDQDLDPVLARVAGPADERLGPGDGERRGPHPGRQLVVGEPGDDRAGIRSLDGEHRVVAEPVAELGVEVARVLAEPLQVALVVGGVGDRQVAVVGEPVGEQVVEHPAVVAAENRVLGAADGDLGDVVGEQPLEQRPRRRGRRSRSRPCARRRRRRTTSAPRGARRGRPRTATGISQPANGTSFAPASTCAS